jgi:hypothetical protein
MLALIYTLLITALASAHTPQEVAKLLDQFKTETSPSKRLNSFSKIFLGRPYGKTGPLGEGPQGKYDQDPLYRFDTFDCTTYVETIMALALSKDTDEFFSTLNDVRYENGEVDFLKRNHFTDLQWIPFNVENGLLIEMTAEIAKGSLKEARALINFPGWILSLKTDSLVVPYASDEEREKLLQDLHREAYNFQPEIATVPYIEISTILAHPKLLQDIPHGAIVNFVRPNWDLTEVAGTHQNISHQGFLFWQGKTLLLRHASTAGSVQELPFIDYLKKFKNHATLKGVHFMRLAHP